MYVSSCSTPVEYLDIALLDYPLHRFVCVSLSLGGGQALSSCSLAFALALFLLYFCSLGLVTLQFMPVCFIYYHRCFYSCESRFRQPQQPPKGSPPVRQGCRQDGSGAGAHASADRFWRFVFFRRQPQVCIPPSADHANKQNKIECNMEYLLVLLYKIQVHFYLSERTPIDLI